MPFRRSFACLWCGRDWQVRADDDLEGWAALCPDCLAKADDNGFLRGRLRTALRQRSAAVAGSTTSATRAPAAVTPAPAAESPAAAVAPAHDDWYLRQGRFSRGPLYDGPWGMELDEVTRWLDAVPMSGVIVELGAGSGWWSALLAEKGELWLYDADGDALDAARKRLMAHGLLAHLHQRDPLASADKQVDVVVAAFLLGGAASAAELALRARVVRAWLKPAGTFVFLELLPGHDDGPIDGPAGRLWPRDTKTLSDAISEAGLTMTDSRQTQRLFGMGTATVTS